MLLRSQKLFYLLVVFVLLVLVGAYFLKSADFATNNFWFGFLAFSLVTILFGYYFGVYRVFGPIIKEVEALMAGTEYKKIFLNRKDEFGLLAQFFNYVTKNLESVSHDLKEGNRMMSELDLASEIQRSILPRAIPMVDKLDVAARTRPAEEVGGDSFGFMQKGRQTFLYLGDVTGHGAPAGLIMMMVNTLLYVYLEMSNDTKEWLTKTNLTLKPRVNGTMFMTTVALRWDPDLEKMFYTGAGHEHILIFRAYEGVCEAIASGGIALGMTDDISEIAKEKELNLKKDDVVVLYTDGIPEARNQSSEMFTLNRLKDAVTRNGKLGTAAQVFEGIAKDFRAFVGEEPQLDDITLIVMRYTGVPVAEVGKTTETSWGQI
jgi:serine phosphatase RsbU (regulator of sigma subunit)